MFSVIEKIRFVLATRLHLGVPRKVKSLKRPNERHWVTVLKRSIKIIGVTVIVLFVFGVLLSYLTPPTIIVTDSYNQTVSADSASYTIRGHISSGQQSALKINGQSVKLVGGDFAHAVELKEGDNRFDLEASNNRGVTKEIYIIQYRTHP